MKKKILLTASFLLLCSCSKIEEIPPYYESSTDIIDGIDNGESETEQVTEESTEETQSETETTVTTVPTERLTEISSEKTVTASEITAPETTAVTTVTTEATTVFTLPSFTTVQTAPAVTVVTTPAPVVTTTAPQTIVNVPIELPAEETTTEPVWEEKSFEVYKPLMASALLMDGEKLSGGDREIDTDKVGSDTITLTVTQDGEEKTVKRSIRIVDTVKPVIVENGSNAEVTVGSRFDINNIVGYADNYDKAPKLTYTGTVDTSKPGSYPLELTVTDASGNSCVCNLNVKVSEKKSAYSDEKPFYFSDLVSGYKNDNTMVGIDVSKWQGDIDFSAVKNAGCEFAYIRIAVDSGSGLTIDERFEEYYKNATKAGLKVGVYVYSRAKSTDDISRTVKTVTSTIGTRKIDLPIAFDWEDFTDFSKYRMSLYDLNKLYSEFDSQCSSYGYKTILYSTKDRLNGVWDIQSSSAWLSDYSANKNYSGSCKMWQCSQNGRIDGIMGAVDLNVMYK